MRIPKGHYYGHFTVEGMQEKSRIESVTADKFLTHDLLIRWCMLYLCAIEAAQNFFAFK